ncbi:MAG: Hsp20/alpha crystallin family protein [Candidatus Woesearchaeota archaeon]
MRRYTIWDEMRRMQEQMDALFDYFFAESRDRRYPLLEAPTSTELMSTNYRKPLLDMTETDKEVIATIELPGVEKEDIQINATEDNIEIKVEKKDEKKEEDKKKGIYKLERSYAGFYRCIPTPENVDVENINATYKNGVLELKMPKIETKKKGKQISVK